MDAGIWEISENRRLVRRGEGRGEVVSRQLSQGDAGDPGDGVMTRRGAEEVLIAVSAGGFGGVLEPQWLPGFLLS